jgi:site-specific DNA-methyltransferase (adenine-specific)
MELYNEDCLERLKKIPDKSVDLIFNDLPYGQTACKWDSIIDIDELWKQYKRIRKDTTPIFFTCSTKFGHTLISANQKEFRYDLVWVKSAPCGFLNSKRMPMKKHEMIYVFYKKLPYYDVSSHKHKFIKEKEKKENRKNDVNNKCYGDNVIYYNKGKYYDPPLPTSIIKDDNLYSTEIYGITDLKRLDFNRNESTYDPPLPNSILEIKSQKGKHPTQKPDELMEWILKYYSKEEDTVLDATMGSGSMGVACKKMNRKFIGIEKDEEIFKVAQERIN